MQIDAQDIITNTPRATKWVNHPAEQRFPAKYRWEIAWRIRRLSKLDDFDKLLELGRLRPVGPFFITAGDSSEEIAIRNLRHSALVHADETGINVNGERIWLNCASNDAWTHF